MSDMTATVTVLDLPGDMWVQEGHALVCAMQEPALKRSFADNHKTGIIR